MPKRDRELNCMLRYAAFFYGDGKKERDLGLNKSDFIREVATKADLTMKDAGKALDAVLATVQETLAKGEKQQFVGFGTFEVRNRSERKIKNPATGEEMLLPATKVPAFKPGKALKEAVVPPKPKPAIVAEAPKVKPAKKAKHKKKK